MPGLVDVIIILLIGGILTLYSLHAAFPGLPVSDLPVNASDVLLVMFLIGFAFALVRMICLAWRIRKHRQQVKVYSAVQRISVKEWEAQKKNLTDSELKSL